MSNSSWRKRRWNIFKKAYDSDYEFRNELASIRIRLRNGEVVEDDETEKLGDIFDKYEIPIDIWQVCMYFLAKPNEPEKVYLERVMPPFLYWNTTKDKIGPYTGTMTATEFMQVRIESAHADGGISFDISKVNYAELAEAIFGDRTVLAVNRNVGIEELKDLILDFSAELDELIKDPSLARGHSKDLLGTVRSATKAPGRTKLEKRITELYNDHNEGRGRPSDYSIAMKLREENQHWDYDEDYIKGVRFRLGLKKIRKKKS